MSNRKVKGEQLYMFIGSAEALKPIGCSTDCSLNLSAEAIEKSKRGQGGWRIFRPGQKSWSMDCAGFYFETAVVPSGFMGGRQAIGTIVKVAITILERELVEAGIDLSTVKPSPAHTLTGDAVITNCAYAGSQGGLATYKISFTGSGDLSPLE